MQLSETKDGDVLVLGFQGPLDTSTAGPFEARLVELIESGESMVIVDCSAIDYVNSAGLKCFLVAAKALDARGGKLIICGLTPNVRMIFDMIGFSQIMTLVPGKADALRLLRADEAAAT